MVSKSIIVKMPSGSDKTATSPVSQLISAETFFFLLSSELPLAHGLLQIYIAAPSRRFSD